MLKKFKINTIQSYNSYILCILGESIAKAIIIYYSLVYIIYASILDKKVKNSFRDSSFFFFLKKLNYLNTPFFSGLSGLVVLFVLTEGVAGEFARPLARPVRPQLLSLNHHYGQEKLSQPKIKNSENSGTNISDKNPSKNAESSCQLRCLEARKTISSELYKNRNKYIEEQK